MAKLINRENLVKFLLALIKGGVFCTVILPIFMHSKFFFPFIVPKNVLFMIVVEIIFIAYLILCHLEPKYKPKLNPIFLAVLVFFIISLVAGLLGISFYLSFWSNYERMSGLFHLAHLVLYLLVLVNVFKERKDWHSFFTFSVFISLIMAFLGFAQWLQVPFLLKSSGGSRLSGTVGNATFFAAYLMFHLFFLLYFLAKKERFNLKLFAWSFGIFDAYLILSGLLYKLFAAYDWHSLNFLKMPILNESLNYPKLLYPFLLFQILVFVIWFLKQKKYTVHILLVISFIFEFFIFFNTQTRGALIGFFAGLGLLLVLSLFSSVNRNLKIASAIILIGLILAPFVLYFNKSSQWVVNNSTLNRLASISLNDITTESRLLTWQASWKGWSENPKSLLFGYGPENYYYVFNKYFPSAIYRDAGSQIWFDRAHNIIFDIGVTTGILGLGAYLSILGLAIFFLFKNYRTSGSVSSSWLLISLIVAYFLQNFFVFDTLNTEIPFYLFLGFVATFAVKDREVEPGVKKEINYIYLAILLVILIFGIFGINARILKTNNYIYKSLTAKTPSISSVGSAFEYFQKAISEALPGRFEARQQLAGYVIDNMRAQSFPPNEVKAMIDYTTGELKKTVEEEPLNVREYLFLSTFYNATTGFDRSNPLKVVNLLEPAINLSPTRAQIYYEIAQAYAFQQDFDNSVNYFKKGLEHAPRVIDSYWNLLTIYIVFQKFDLANEEFELMQKELNWQPTLADYNRLIDLYGRVKKYDQMITFQEKVIELEPVAKNYAKIAVLYARIGNNQKAKEASNRAVVLDPTFAKEAEEFLKQLNAGSLKEN